MSFVCQVITFEIHILVLSVYFAVPMAIDQSIMGSMSLSPPMMHLQHSFEAFLYTYAQMVLW